MIVAVLPIVVKRTMMPMLRLLLESLMEVLFGAAARKQPLVRLVLVLRLRPWLPAMSSEQFVKKAVCLLYWSLYYLHY